MKTYSHQAVHILVSTILCMLPFTAMAAQPAEKPLAVDNLIQVVAKDSATAKTISWQSDTPRQDYTVTYRRKGTAESGRAYVTDPKRPPVYDSGNVPPYTYGAYMQGLAPDTAYEYRISNEDGTSDWFSFTTTREDEDSYDVLLFSDSQSVDYSLWGQTARTAWEHHPDAAFFICLGDLTDNGQAWFQWRSWAEYADVLTSHLPIAPVLGNHEAYSMTWTYAEPYTYMALFAVPYGGPQGQNRLAYSFDYGDVHYVSLNTDDEELRDRRPSMLADEAAWLDADLAAAKRQGKRLIVLMHRPPWNSPYDGTQDSNGTYFVPLFEKYQVPLVFAGHEHCYARTEPVRGGKVSQQGTVYVTAGRSGSEAWDGSVRKPEDAVYYNPMDMPMYLTLHVSPSSFTVTASKIDGTCIDRAVIPAPKPGQEKGMPARDNTKPKRAAKRSA